MNFSPQKFPPITTLVPGDPGQLPASQSACNPWGVSPPPPDLPITPTISQAMLNFYVRLKQRAEALDSQLETEEEEFLALLASGAQVEQGPLGLAVVDEVAESLSYDQLASATTQDYAAQVRHYLAPTPIKGVQVRYR